MVIFMLIVLSHSKTGLFILLFLLGIIIFPSINTLSASDQILGQDTAGGSGSSFPLDNASLVFNKDNFSSIIYTANRSLGVLAGVYWGDQALAAVVIKNTTTTDCGNNRIGVVIAYRQLVGEAKIYANGYLIQQQPIYNIRMNYFYLGSLLEFIDNNSNGMYDPAVDTLLTCANLTNLTWKISFSNTTVIAPNPTSLGTISISATNVTYANSLNSVSSGNTITRTNMNQKISLIQFNFTISAKATPVSKNGYIVYPVDINRRTNQIVSIQNPINNIAHINGYDLGFNIKMNHKIVGWNFSSSNSKLAFPVRLGVIDIISHVLPKLSVILHTAFLREDTNILGKKSSTQNNNIFEYQFQTAIRKTFQNSFGQIISFQSNTSNESINDSTLGYISPNIIKPHILMKNFWEQNVLANENSFDWVDNGTFDNKIIPIAFQINKANITKEAVQFDTNGQLAFINKLEVDGNFIYHQGQTIIIDPSMQTVGTVLPFPSIQSQSFNIRDTLEYSPAFLLGFSIVLTVALVIVHIKKSE